MVVFLESNRMMATIQALKAERELCLQDITSFQKWREGVKERKQNCGSWSNNKRTLIDLI